MKKILTFLFCAVLLAAAPGCGPSGQGGVSSSGSAGSQEQAEPEQITFTDDLGRTVSIPRPERVAALIGSFADIWCTAGGKDTLAAAANDSWTQFDLGLSDQVKNLGTTTDPSLEALLAADPDFVLGSTKTAADVALLDTLDELGIPAACFNVSSFQDYLRLLNICTQLTGCPENYQLYGENVAAQVEAAQARADGSAPTVLYIRSTGSSCKVKNSQDTVLGEMLADLGCVNIADSQTSLLENLSLETILAADPEYIFVILQGSDPTNAQATLDAALLSNPAWDSLTAVAEGRFYVMDQQLYNVKPNARWGEAYEQLADILYPAQ